MDTAGLLKSDNLRRWAYSTDLDKAHEKAHFEDEHFEYELNNALTMDLLWEFASDVSCFRRRWFLSDYVEHIAFIYRKNSPLLPFHFSRFCGLMDKNEYLSSVQEYALSLYELCTYLDKMKDNECPVIKTLYHRLMDCRNTTMHLSYDGLIRRLAIDIDEGFRLYYPSSIS